MTKLNQHFLNIGACSTGQEWVAKNCTTAEECWGGLLDAGRVDWAVWWLASDRGWQAAEPLARRWALRAIRVHAAAIMDAYKLPASAIALRALSDRASFGEIRNAALDALDALAALAALDALAAEKRQQIADLRELCECPWHEED